MLHVTLQETKLQIVKTPRGEITIRRKGTRLEIRMPELDHGETVTIAFEGEQTVIRGLEPTGPDKMQIAIGAPREWPIIRVPSKERRC